MNFIKQTEVKKKIGMKKIFSKLTQKFDRLSIVFPLIIKFRN